MLKIKGNAFFLFNSDIELAKAVDNILKIDTFYIDLEIIGKEQRQQNRNTLISYHNLNDITKNKT